MVHTMDTLCFLRSYPLTSSQVYDEDLPLEKYWSPLRALVDGRYHDIPQIPYQDTERYD